ncbi:MAG: hypothetical protein EP332_00045 [Bacteroidetes bacterium]|nr:MAG: hypothetical protein EP332_00045 [Bacteroidota bacterium]
MNLFEQLSIPGWTSHIEEISNGVYKVSYTDAHGRKAEAMGTSFKQTIDKAASDAFDIEKQISENWNLFLFELAVQTLAEENLCESEYSDKAFGSWHISKQDNRLVYDGKDALLIFETRTKGRWNAINTIPNAILSYSDFIGQLNMLSNTTNQQKTKLPW